MSDKRVALKNLIISSFGKVVSFFFLFSSPLLLKDSGLSDSNLFLFSQAALFLTLFTVITTNVISVLIVKELYVERQIGKSLKKTGHIISVFGNWILLLVITIIALLFFFEQNIFLFLKVHITPFQFKLFVFGFGIMVLNDYGRCIVQSFNLFNSYSFGVLCQAIIQLMVYLTCIFILKDKIIAFPLSFFVSSLFLFFYILIIILKSEFKPKFEFNFKLGAEYHFFKISSPLFAAHIVTVVVGFSFDYAASALDKGTYTLYTLAFRLFTLPTIFLLTPLNEILNKRFAEFSIANLHRLSEEVNYILRHLIILIVPFIFLLLMFTNTESLLILRALTSMKVGNGENSQVFFNTFSNVMLMLMIYLFFNLFSQIASRVYFSLHKTFLSSVAGTVNFILCFILLQKWSSSIYEIVLAKISPEIFYLFPFSIFLVKKYLPDFNIYAFLRILFMALVISTAVFLADHFLFNAIYKNFLSDGLSLVKIVLIYSSYALLFIAVYYWIFKKDIELLGKSLIKKRIQVVTKA